MKKFNKKEFGEKVRKHLGEIIVALVVLVLLIGLLSTSVPFLSDFFNRSEEPDEPTISVTEKEPSYTDDTISEPTCTDKTCEIPEDKPIEQSPNKDPEPTTEPSEPVAIHTHAHAIDTVIAPTCLDKGYSVSRCECGDTYKKDYKDALGHSWSEWVITKQPTEQSEGTKTRTCERCGITESQSIAKLSHSHSHAVDRVVAPTCTEKGYSVYSCSCGDTYKKDYKDALGHAWSEWTVVKQSTEDEEGTEKRTCERCGIEESRSIDKLPHSHSYAVENVVEPTCTEQGYSIYVCKCGDTYKADYKDALGHDWKNWIVVKQPTYFEEGLEIRTCSRCDEEEERSIAKLPVVNSHSHSYAVDEIVEPTCTEQGYTVYNCRCGHTYKADYKDALDHDWNEWTVTKQPTETEEGEEKRTCKRNDAEESRSIDKLPHSHSHAVDRVVAPTCTEQGYTVYRCACGDNYQADYTDALNHDWNEWTVTKQPTTTEEGTEKRVCSRGDAEEERSIDKLPVTLRIGNIHTNSSLFTYSLNNWDAYSHTNTWEAVTFNNTPSNFSGECIWTDGTNVYYDTTHILNGDTWEEVELYTNTLSHRDFWTDGENIYYSYEGEQYILDKVSQELVPTRWNGLRSFYGSYIWTDGENIYYSYNRNQYVLNGDTWEAITWNGDLTSFMGHRIWSDGTNTYYSFGNNQYVLNGDTWEAVTWNGALTSFSGEYVWTDGTNVYYDTGYVLNGNTWQATTFTGIPDDFAGVYLWSEQIWSDGYNIYRFYDGKHYVLK